MKNLVNNDSSIENIWVLLSLEAQFLAVIILVVDSDVAGEVVGSDVDKIDSAVWLVVGVVQDEEEVFSDESELDWGDVVTELEGNLVHVVLSQGVDDKGGALVGLGGVEEGLLVLANAVTVDEVDFPDSLDLSVLVDIVDGGLGELSHVQNSALLVIRVVANPVEEVEFRVDGEAGAPLTDDLGGLEVVDLQFVVGWGVVEDLLGGDLGEPVGVDAEDAAVLLVLRELSFVHDLSSKSVPHDVVPGFGEDEQDVVRQGVGLDVLGLEWQFDAVFGYK